MEVVKKVSDLDVEEGQFEIVVEKVEKIIEIEVNPSRFIEMFDVELDSSELKVS